MLAKKCYFVGIFILFSVSLAIAAPPAVHPTTGEPLVIDCLRGTPDAIDGDLSDWNLEAMTPAVLDVVEQLNSGQDSWTGPEDCSGEFYMLWDDVNIYIAVVVKDDKLSMNKTDGDIWNADCIEVLFSTTNAEAVHSWTNPTIHYQYGFNANDQIWNWCNMDGPGQSVPDYLQAASSITADGYICEVSIPHSEITPLDWFVGSIIGFHPCIDDTDIDNGDTELQMSWTGLAAHDQSLGFGHMVLSADPVPAPAEKTVLFAEDFEGLALGPNVDEELAGDAVWTDTPPEGWSVDDSGIPGISMDATDGVTEWAGWAFADKAWWIEAAGDQDRSLFELGSGIVAVADPDEWDDDERLPIPIAVDPYDTWLTTPEIKIASAEAGTLELMFDSSWRPEFDDNLHQTANITASFDGGEPVVVMLWESDEASANYKPYATNETVIVKLDNPEGAKKLVLTFGLFDAGNDWWWAIDNIEVSGVVLSQEPVNPGVEGLAAFYALAGDANDSSGNGIDGIIHNADTGGLGIDGSVWVDDPERGTVISFNGTAEGAYVRAGNIPQMTLTNDFTWAFWAKHNAENTADNDIILGNRYNEDGVDFVPRQFIKFTPTKFEWHMNGNGDDNLDYDDIPADIWLHHAVVKTGDQLTYYRNGIEASSGTFTQPLDFPQPLYFGGDNTGAEGENWSGLMGEVGIYNRALSEAEIRYLAGERAVPVDPGSDGLAAAYVFDADAADSSGNGLDGTLLGDAHAADGVLVLDGEDDAVAIPGIGDGLTEFTFSMMVYPTVDLIPLQFSGGINTDSWTGGIHFKLNNGNLNVGVNGLAGGDVVGTSIIEPDKWTHLVLTVSPEEVAVYVNGEKEGSRTGEVVPAINVGAATIGAWNNSGTDVQREMTGMMDDVLIYNRALSAGEIRYLAGFRVLPVHSYTFEDGTGNDSIGQADGVMMGDAAIVDGSLVVDGDGDWMEMPGDVIAINTYSEMTLELWSTQSVDNAFSMTASFGGTWDNGMGKDYICICTGRGDQMNRGSIANTPDGVNPWEDEVGISSPELNDGIEHHYVLTITEAELAYYVDGVLIGTAPMGDTTISGLSNDFVYLGKGIYSVDPTMNCSINEFNIYGVALSEKEIAANYAAGPVE